MILDERIFKIINKSIYGGNCQVFKKYAKLTKDRVSYLAGLNKNNLYGWAGC